MKYNPYKWQIVQREKKIDDCVDILKVSSDFSDDVDCSNEFTCILVKLGEVSNNLDLKKEELKLLRDNVTECKSDIKALDQEKKCLLQRLIEES